MPIVLNPKTSEGSTLKTETVLGTFSKGVKSARTINFGVSGGANCATECRHHPLNYVGADSRAGLCYAKVVEGRDDRKQLADKLARHEALPASQIIGRAFVELSRVALNAGKLPQWLRFSTNGALPTPAAPAADRRIIPLLVETLQFAKKHTIPVHLPVETADKAAFYRAKLGELVTVRESIQTADMSPETIASHAIPAGPVSFTAGESVAPGKNKRGRILAAAAAAAAAWSKLTGRKTIVCPAVRVSFLARTNEGKAGRSPEQVDDWRARNKCGNCPACAMAHIDVVYPCH